MSSASSQRDPKRGKYIPCLYMKPSYESFEKRLLIHYHANAEDISQCVQMCQQFCFYMKCYVLCVEYPGYGLYTEDPSDKRTKVQAILDDVKIIMDYSTQILGFELRNIMISGRSIGTGPATFAASQYNVMSLLLTSPIKSVGEIAKQHYGSFA